MRRKLQTFALAAVLAVVATSASSTTTTSTLIRNSSNNNTSTSSTSSSSTAVHCIVQSTAKQHLGDGICDEGTSLNTLECGWDDGDCILKEYPNCHVRYPSRIGNGHCDDEDEDGHGKIDRYYDGDGIVAGSNTSESYYYNYYYYYDHYNSKACGYDGGDCIHQETIMTKGMDNHHDDVTNKTSTATTNVTTTITSSTAKTKNDKRSGGQVAGIVVGSMALVALVLFSQWIFVQSRNQYATLVGGVSNMGVHSNTTGLLDNRSTTRRRTPAVVLFPWGGLTRNSVRWDETKRQERIALVLQNIICKKVLPLSSLSSVLSATSSWLAIPNGSHESISVAGASHHSSSVVMMRAGEEEDDVSTILDGASRQGGGDAGGALPGNHPHNKRSKHHPRKDHMYIDGTFNPTTTTHHTTTHSCSSPSKHSLRHGMRVASSHHSLYSPRCCSICYEEYKIGDDISWSPNDDCPHVYHLSCILEWLLDHDHCPMCRAKYINVDDDAIMKEFPISTIPTHVIMGNDDQEMEEEQDDDDDDVHDDDHGQ